MATFIPTPYPERPIIIPYRNRPNFYIQGTEENIEVISRALDIINASLPQFFSHVYQREIYFLQSNQWITQNVNDTIQIHYPDFFDGSPKIYELRKLKNGSYKRDPYPVNKADSLETLACAIFHELAHQEERCFGVTHPVRQIEYGLGSYITSEEEFLAISAENIIRLALGFSVRNTHLGEIDD